MLELEFRSWKIEVGGGPYSIFHILSTVFNTCVQAVFSVGIVSGLSNALHTGLCFINSALCSTSPLITNFYSTFTSGFTLLNRSGFNLFNTVFIPTIHTTNKDNDILYKLITIN